MSQLPMFPKFICRDNHSQTGQNGFNTIQEAAKYIGKVTLNRDYNLSPKLTGLQDEIRLRTYALIAMGQMHRETLFKEIHATSRNIPKDFWELLTVKRRRKPLPLEDYAGKLLEALTEGIEGMWKPNVENILSFSSGYDSRLIAGVLRKLQRNDGYEFFENIYFKLFQPEIAPAYKVLKFLGWSIEHTIVHQTATTGVDCYASAFEWETVGKEVSDVNRILCIAFNHCILSDLPSGPVRIISGLYHDELLRIKDGGLAEFYVKHLYDIHFEFGAYDHFLPFCSEPVVKIFSRYKIDAKPDDVKREMCRQLWPGLEELENFRFKHYELKGRHECNYISADTRINWLKKFNNSAYAKETKTRLSGLEVLGALPFEITNEHPALKHYVKAAICEHLIESGVEVRFE